MNIRNLATRLIATFTLSAFAASGLAMTPATAAPGDPAYPNPGISIAESYFGDQMIQLAGSFNATVPNTTLSVFVFGCTGQVIGSGASGGSGAIRTVVDLFDARNAVPPAVQIHLVYSAPGYSDVTQTTSVAHDYPGAAANNCSGGGDNNGSGGSGENLSINKWSKKKGKPFLGNKVSVTKTRTNGNAEYTWYAGSKKVKTGRDLRVAPKFKGKTIKMKIVVTKGGTTKRKSLNFGTARRR